jgi:hypothetical protein
MGRRILLKSETGLRPISLKKKKDNIKMDEESVVRLESNEPCYQWRLVFWFCYRTVNISLSEFYKIVPVLIYLAYNIKILT